MVKSLGESTANENSAITSYDGLMAAKTKEVNALTSSIEEKMVRLGELQVSVVEMKEDPLDLFMPLPSTPPHKAQVGSPVSTSELQHYWKQVHPKMYLDLKP